MNSNWIHTLRDDHRGSGVLHTTVLVTLLLFVSIGFSWSFFKYQATLSYEELSQTEAGREELRYRDIENTLARVGKLISLPEGKLPSITTVYEAEALTASQDLFKDIKNGDKVIVYDDQVIIYRESNNTLVHAGSLVAEILEADGLDDTATSTDSLDSNDELQLPGVDIKIEIRNGTKVKGFAGRTQDELRALGYTVISIGNASKNTYASTTIIILTDKSGEDLERRYDSTSTSILPKGEQESSADILLILGAN